MNCDFGNVVVDVARRAIETGFTAQPPRPAELIATRVPDSTRRRFDEPGAVFVTISDSEGRLRGCIGSLRARRRLGDDIVHNARRAAEDPRLPAVTPEEFDRLVVSVAVLSTPTVLDVSTFAALLRHLSPGVDGLTLLDTTGKRATFLPSVWKTLPNRTAFVRALLRKGGWDVTAPEAELESYPWPEGMTAERYTTTSFAESRRQ
ncbi:AmmeMemoRadiSam system protein A [Haloglycomyces albus]|uniref:AmmeMemoRadiSam system protein A n=1 Tax=Haloglycomyces albus TaxID=526067 RepID=UPI00046D022A|nr:AmmeMemoRadiSam system protein A [Haloglycomyces albus]